MFGNLMCNGGIVSSKVEFLKMKTLIYNFTYFVVDIVTLYMAAILF